LRIFIFALPFFALVSIYFFSDASHLVVTFNFFLTKPQKARGIVVKNVALLLFG
jgi:hypothetical protein